MPDAKFHGTFVVVFIFDRTEIIIWWFVWDPYLSFSALFQFLVVVPLYDGTNGRTMATPNIAIQYRTGGLWWRHSVNNR